MPENERVRTEIETFLQALTTYPQRFAVNPQISFEEHRASLILAAPSVRRSERETV